MASVIGSAKTLRVRWRDLTPDQRDSFLALIDHETNRLAELVGDVLDTSRIESGTFSYTFSDLDIGEIVRESAAAAESSQDEVAVRADVTAPLPTLRGDRERLRQVVTNLIDNAVKFTRPRDMARIEIGSQVSEADGIVCYVRDNGVGFNMQRVDKLFGMFQRLHPASKFEGTGIGLANVQRIVLRHGGRVWAQSQVEHGATFYFTLPRPQREEVTP